MARWDRAWFARLDREMAELPFLDEGRRSAIRRALGSDPVAFAVLYLSHHLKDRNGKITWSTAHFEWARQAEAWKGETTQPQEHRIGIIAPRECGKSTWWFLILPLWAACNGHTRFTAAFAHAASQAEAHLATMRAELETNPLLRMDYPQHTTPGRMRSGSTKADRAGMLHMESGWVFAARGIDSAVLGMKVGDQRPDLLVLDDVEPDEANYSPLLAEKRLGTITDAILPLNIYAKVVFVGTVTMPGSIMHQLVKAAQGVETEDWIKDANIRPFHFRPLVTQDDGTEVSIWPEKWPTAWLQAHRHERSYAKNYDNDPMAREGVYWRREDFTHGWPEGRRATRWTLAVDPAVTSNSVGKNKSDFTGLAVIGKFPELRERPTKEHPRGKLVAPEACIITYSAGVRLTGQHLKEHVIRLLADHPEVREILVETNQGGDLWRDVFAGIPGIQVKTTHATESKEVRFATALEFWQRGRVFHAQPWATLEEQAVGFPRAAYDDVVDAAVTGVMRYLAPPKTVRAGARSESYLGSVA